MECEELYKSCLMRIEDGSEYGQCAVNYLTDEDIKRDPRLLDLSRTLSENGKGYRPRFGPCKGPGCKRPTLPKRLKEAMSQNPGKLQ